MMQVIWSEIVEMKWKQKEKCGVQSLIVAGKKNRLDWNDRRIYRCKERQET